LFVVIFLLASWKLQGNFSFSKQAWRGTFEDEFLNMVSLNAYKVGFFSVTFACMLGVFGVYDSVPLSRQDLLTCFLGISGFAYGITIAVGLRKDDE
jgi:ABC-type spermidine/putrescine transport system permease subunit II